LLALSGGFFAWTFAGSIEIKARGIIPGAAIVAAGGFAVFVLLTQGLKVGAEADSSCTKPLPSAEQIDKEKIAVQARSATEKLAVIAVSTANVNAAFIQLKANLGDPAGIHKQAQVQLTNAKEMSRQHLAALQQGALSLYQAHLAAIASMTVESSVAAAKDGRMYALQAAESARQALKDFTDAKNGGSGYAELAKSHLANLRSEDKALYLIGISKILDVQFSELDGNPSPYKEDDIFKSFEPLSVNFLREAYAATDGPVKWFCQSKPIGRPPCV
jgi:hypothetical protein